MESFGGIFPVQDEYCPILLLQLGHGRMSTRVQLSIAQLPEHRDYITPTNISYNAQPSNVCCLPLGPLCVADVQGHLLLIMLTTYMVQPEQSPFVTCFPQLPSLHDLEGQHFSLMGPGTLI